MVGCKKENKVEDHLVDTSWKVESSDNCFLLKVGCKKETKVEDQLEDESQKVESIGLTVESTRVATTKHSHKKEFPQDPY